MAMLCTGLDLCKCGGLAIALMAVFLFFCQPAHSSVTLDQAAATGAPFMVYMPDGMDRSVKHPCIFALSPNGRGERSLAFMKAACDKYHWVLVAPENRGRAVRFLALDRVMLDTLKTAISRFPIDKERIVAGGFAGGAMEAHHMSFICSQYIKGVIANCGIIHAEAMREPEYAKGKLAVLITNADDFRYMQMKQNADFLTDNLWHVSWMESSGGHRWAAPDVYASAFAWLDEQMRVVQRQEVITNTPAVNSASPHSLRF